MKHALKTKCLILILLFGLICSSLLLGGCSKSAERTGYVGTYRSIFVDSQNEDDSISFTLVINKNNKFVLTCYNGDKVNEYKGYYKTYTDQGQEQLLCIVEEGYVWSSLCPNAWNPYFSICRLDDGTLMATAGSTSSYSSVSTAFGSGEKTKITLILFSKE